MTLLETWQKHSKSPIGRLIFYWAFRRFVPYSASISPKIESWESGKAVVSLRDHFAIRNHLKSVHAVALVNLAELTSGLAVIGTTGPDIRGILTGFEIKYSKKSRGKITATSEIKLPEIKERTPFLAHVVLRDEAGDEVCRAQATWLLEPRPR